MSGLTGTWEIGTQPLWPSAELSVSDMFDRPVWERPTVDTGFTLPQPGAAETFSGSTGFLGGGSFTGSPGFVGGSALGAFWIPPATGSVPTSGGRIIVSNTGGVFALDVVASRRDFYRIEVRDADGVLLSNVTQWFGGTLKMQMDRASELTFTIPYDGEGAADLVRPNVIWLRDRWGFVVDTFIVQKRKPKGRMGASYFEIYAQGLMAQLAEELVIKYNGADITVLEHVTALFDLQARSDALTIGTIDPAIADTSLPFFAADTNIHSALLAIQAALPKADRGRIYIDPQRRLQWRVTVGDQTEQVITRAHNVTNIEAETDYTQLVNRIYMYGEGNDPDTRLTLVDAGEAHEYVENTSSQTAYGLRAAIQVDRRIRDADTLLLVANRILEEFGTPPVNVSVDLLDLAKSDDAPTGWTDIYIGGKYRVVDSDLALDTSIEIVGIEIDMAHPVPLRVELTNQTRTMADLLSALLDSLYGPLYVLGDQYPNMGRNLSDGATPDTARAGDTRWNSGAGKGQMHDGTDWQDMGGGATIWYTASTFAGLPAASGVATTALGRVDGSGSDNGYVCVVNPAHNAWDVLNFWT